MLAARGGFLEWGDLLLSALTGSAVRARPGESIVARQRSAPKALKHYPNDTMQ